jgi:hypothetical protein
MGFGAKSLVRRAVSARSACPMGVDQSKVETTAAQYFMLRRKIFDDRNAYQKNVLKIS